MTVIPLSDIKSISERHPNMRAGRLVHLLACEQNRFELTLEPILRNMARELVEAEQASEFERIFGKEASHLREVW